MKARILGLLAMVLAVSGTTVAAATKVTGTGGCCPFCK